MKIRFLLLIALLLTSLFSKSQTRQEKFAIGLSLGKTEYSGDYGSAILDYKQKFLNRTTGISFITFLNPDFDLGILAQYGDYGYIENLIEGHDSNWFLGTKTDVSIFTRYKFNNDIFLSSKSKFSPFVAVGIGLAGYGLSPNDKSETMAGVYPTIKKDGLDLIIPIGLGIKYQVSSSLALQYQYLYSFTNSDKHDENRGPNFFGTISQPGIKVGNDAYGEQQLSLVLIISKPRYNHRGLVVRYHHRRR